MTKKIFAQFIFIVLGSVISVSQNFPESTIVETRKLGPYSIGKNNSKVLVSIDKAFLPKSYPHDRSPSDYHLAIKNLKGKTLYSESFDYGGGDALDYDVDTINLSTLGVGLIIYSEYSPSTAAYGVAAKILGIATNGKLMVLTRVFNGTSSFKPVIIDSVLCIEVEQWNGNFGHLSYYVVHKDGKYLEDEKPYPIKQIPVQISEDGAKEYRKRFNNEIEYLTLFLKPKSDVKEFKLIVVTKNTTVQFIDASIVDYEWWLHIVVDKQEGYITGYKEFQKVGLPSAD